MAEEEKNITPESQDIDYISALTDLRNNTVDKEKYAQLKEENARLLKSLINGDTIEASDAPQTPDIEQLRKDLFGGEVQLSNLEYVTKALDLRDALMEQGKPDPFLPKGHEIAPTPQDIEAANRVAQVMRECADESDGDSDLFTSLLMRQTLDVKVPHARK